jgi:hypothetical protein
MINCEAQRNAERKEWYIQMYEEVQNIELKCYEEIQTIGNS